MAIIIDMPKLSDTMTSGTLIRWLKREGDRVSSGDMLAEVETDKATMELENFEEGILLKQYVQPGEKIAVGKAICAIGQSGEAAPLAPDAIESNNKAQEVKLESVIPTQTASEAKLNPKSESDYTVKSDPSDVIPASNTFSEEAVHDKSFESENNSTDLSLKRTSLHRCSDRACTESQDSHIKASPLAKKIARDYDIQIHQLSGTGPGGRIVKDDVLSALAHQNKDKNKEVCGTHSNGSLQTKGLQSPQNESTAIPSGFALPHTKEPVCLQSFGINLEDRVEPIKKPVSGMRAVIARRLLESKTQIPHFYLEIEVNAAPLVNLRQTMNQNLSTLASGDRTRETIKLTVNDFILKAAAYALIQVPALNASWKGDAIETFSYVDLAFGVALPDGLLTPVIRNSEKKSLCQISIEAKALIEKARLGKLSPLEMSNSTFTVTNLGMYDIQSFYGIVNPPNAGILSVGGTVKKPVVDDQDNIVIGHRMTVGFSGDHRVADGATCALFLQSFKQFLENPTLLLV